MKPNRILLIINPHSGRMKAKTGLFEILDELYRIDQSAEADPIDENSGRRSPLYNPAQTDRSALAELDDLLVYGRVTATTLGGEPDNRREVTVVPTMHRGHATQLAATSVAGGFDTVVTCGGDGTLNETLAGLMAIPAESRPPLGYIPTGSTNDFASSLGLPTDIREAARMAVSDFESPVDIGCFIPAATSHAERRYFSYIATFGLFTSVSYSTSQPLKNMLGHTAYVLEGVRDLTNIQQRHAIFTLADGTRLEDEYLFCAVTNTTTVGGILRLPGEAVSMSDGHLEVFLIRAPRTPAELNKLSLALASSDFKACPCIEFHSTSAVDILVDEPLSWSLDGEEAQAGTSLRIECVHRAINLETGTEALFEW